MYDLEALSQDTISSRTKENPTNVDWGEIKYKKRTARQHKFITVKRFISLSETQQHAEKSKMVTISMTSLSHMHTRAHTRKNKHTHSRRIERKLGKIYSKTT